MQGPIWTLACHAASTQVLTITIPASRCALQTTLLKTDDAFGGTIIVAKHDVDSQMGAHMDKMRSRRWANTSSTATLGRFKAPFSLLSMSAHKRFCSFCA